MSYVRTKDLKWLGRSVLHRRVSIADLPDELPTFKRMPFASGENCNEHLEVILREPFQDDQRTIPVAAVSKKYALIQHVALAKQVREALKGKPDTVTFDNHADVHLSGYGERFSASICLTRSAPDPGDGFPLTLRLFLLNSVDGSCPIEISLRWLRQVCTNGMTVLRKQDRLAEIHHLDRINPVAIREFIAKRVPDAMETEIKTFGSWLDMKLVKDPFLNWIKKDVCKAWGLHAAARLFHICGTGFDGRVGRSKPGVTKSPLDLFVSSDQKVPGAQAPVDNLYHVYQALVWLSEHRGTIEDRELRGEQALSLLKKLEKRLK